MEYSTEKFSLAQLFVEIFSRQIYSICQSCEQVFTHFDKADCRYHPENEPYMTNGGFIGIFSCCGEHILTEGKAISIEKGLIHNQVNSGCKLKEHVSMNEEDPTLSAVKKRIGF